MILRVGSIGGLVILATLAVASCRAPVRAILDRPFDLAVGRVAHLQGSDLDIAFRRVVTDSRCPRGAQCVWAGEATVAVEAKDRNTSAESLEARLSGAGTPDSGPWTEYDGYRIQVRALEPYPVAGNATDTTSYVVTLVVARR